MFTNMPTLTVVHYTPKVSNGITHKLPPKPRWTNLGKEHLMPLPVSAKVVEESERRMKPATASGLVPTESPFFDARKSQGQTDERVDSGDGDYDLIKRHRARFERKSLEDGSGGSIPRRGSDESIELDGKLDLDNNIETAHIQGGQGGGSPTFDRDQSPDRISTREDVDDDSDDDLPPLNQLLEKFKRKSPEGGSDAKDSVVEGDHLVLDNDFFGPQESRAGSSSDEPIEIGDDSKLDLGEDRHATNSPPTQSDKRSDHDRLDVGSSLALSAGSADEPVNNIKTTDTNSSSGRAKRVRFASPCNIPSLGLSTPPHSCDGDGKRSMTDPESSDSDESRDRTTSPKRRKLSPPQDDKAALNGPNGQSERSPLDNSDDDDELDGLVNLADDSSISSGGISIPSTLDSTLQSSRICPKFVDINQEWEYRRIICEEVVGGVSYYEMEWCSSLIPKSSVGNKEVIAEYEARKARARAHCGAKGKQMVRPLALKQDSQVMTEACVPAGRQQKRPRGRPRKEMTKEFKETVPRAGYILR